jgi:AcrR family transcriptional regulator
MEAVRQLLAEGRFHESSVEQVAERAGISRATLYQHFRSRTELVDEMCDAFDANPALLAIRGTVVLDDPRAALDQTIANCVAFWSSEDPVLEQLYGVAAVDEAARDLVDRQRADRRGEMKRLARRLKQAAVLRRGVGETTALNLLMLLSSYESYRELRAAGLSDREVTKTLRETAHRQLLG